jgi:hypothetical protein
MTAPVAPAIYRKLRTKGVVFWLDDGKPYCYGPPGAVTEDCIAQLREERAQLVVFLTALDDDVSLWLELG